VKSRRIGNTSLEVTDQPGGAAAGCGHSLFDTAPSSGFGLSERRMGDVLRDTDVLSTKAARLLRPVPVPLEAWEAFDDFAMNQ
jgi:aryl-alcohol dehydrogenase-like predicted oxidoreductase